MQKNSTIPALEPVKLTEKAIIEVKNIMENKSIPSLEFASVVLGTETVANIKKTFNWFKNILRKL